MLRSENVATPAAAAAAACDLPERRALRTPGSLPIARVTSPVKLVTTLPTESYTVTCTAGVIVLSFMASVGCTVNASLGGADPGGDAWLPPGVLVNSLSK